MLEKVIDVVRPPLPCLDLKAEVKSEANKVKSEQVEPAHDTRRRARLPASTYDKKEVKKSPVKKTPKQVQRNPRARVINLPVPETNSNKLL